MTEKQSEVNLGGRPLKNPEDVNANWQEEMLEAYGNGKSDVWVRARVFKAISNDLWYRWTEDDTFSETVKRGRALSQAWWEDVSTDHAVGNNTDANATSLIFNMSNRFKDEWKQRQSVDQVTTVKADIDDLKKIDERLREYGIDPNSL
jgi:hypothetical protein